MLNTIIDRCNSFAQTWAWWIGMSILDAAIVLAVVSIVWLAIRRKASPQLGYLLFLLIPLKLFVPLEIAVPEQIVAWMPRVALPAVQQADMASSPSSEAIPKDFPIAANKLVAPVITLDERPLATAPIDTPLPPAAFVASPKLSWLAWLMLGWASGVLVLFARLILSQVRFHRVVLRKADPIDPARFAVDFGGLLRRIRAGRNIRIVESRLISSPVVGGIFRPMLILPTGIASTLSASQMEWVLLHELAHVRRRDLIVKVFQCLATILHFVNPAVWIANRMINRLREFACDDMASAFGNGSQVESGEAFLGVMRYAASIQHRAEVKLDGAIGVFESTARSSCFERMKRLLDTNRRITVRLGLGSICVLLLTAILALPQIRAANQPAEEEKPAEQAAEEVFGKKEEPKLNAGESKAVATEKAQEEKNAVAIDAVDASFHFSVIIARHVMLLEGREIVTWKQIEEIIAKRPNPSQTCPAFYITRGAHEAGLYEPTKQEMWRLHADYKLVGHIEGSLSPLANMRYDEIQTPADLKPDESLRINGTVLGKNGKPVADAEVILVTPIDDSISYKTHAIYLVQGRVRQPLEEIIARSDKWGDFSLYPPKGKNYALIAMHPDVGIGYSGRDQLAQNEKKIHLLEWAGLVSEFGKEPEKQNASIDTRLPPSGDLPEIVFSQYWSDLKDRKPTLLFGFTHVPPIFQTTVSRSFPEKDGGAISAFSLPGASVGLLVGETRRLDLGPLTEQQRKWLGQMRKDSAERQRKFQEQPKKTESKPATANDNPPPNLENRFELTVLGPDKKPVPGASVDIWGYTPAENLPDGKSIKQTVYQNLLQTDAHGFLAVDLPKKPQQFHASIEQPGFGLYQAAWTNDSGDEFIPAKFVAQLDAGWSVGGIVVDSQGKPIEGVTINPRIQPKMRPGDNRAVSGGKSVATDAQGQWRYDCVPVSQNDVFVEIDHPNFKPTRLSLPQNGFGISLGSQPAAKIQLEPGITVTGKVTDDAGRPIAGALVKTKFLNDLREAKTNEKGEYQLVGCEPKMARIVVSAKGKATDIKEVMVAPGMEPVNFEMKPGGKVRIRVLDQNGNPAAKARIFFQRWRGMFQYFEFNHVSQYADENGVWQWNEAPLDEFQADICPTGGMQLEYRPLLAGKEEYVFRTYPLLVVSGRVLDAETKEPIQSFRVVPGHSAYDNPNAKSGNTRRVWDRQDSYPAKDGQYRVQFSRESLAHLVRIEADGYSVAVSRDIKSNEGNVTLDFALVKAKDIAATLLTPDGQPAAGAKIAIGIAGSQIGVNNGQFDNSTYAARCEADDAGRFHFPFQEGPYQLVILHPSGFHYFKSDDQKLPDRITLTAWARAEGAFRIGSKPAANVPLTVNTESIHSYGKNVPHISTSHYATTGADGRFVFERVFPGGGRIGRNITLMVRDGATEVASSTMIPANFKAGETTHIDLGGSGRPVIGKLLKPAGFNEKVLWQFAMIDVQNNFPEPKAPPIPADIQKDPEKSKAWWKQWKETDEGKAWTATTVSNQNRRSENPYFWATVASDGSFRIDDVPEGDYILDVRFSEHPAGHLSKHRFSVTGVHGDPSSQSLDLGELTLEKN